MCERILRFDVYSQIGSLFTLNEMLNKDEFCSFHSSISEFFCKTKGVNEVFIFSMWENDIFLSFRGQSLTEISIIIYLQGTFNFFLVLPFLLLPLFYISLQTCHLYRFFSVFTDFLTYFGKIPKYRWHTSKYRMMSYFAVKRGRLKQR